MRRRALGPWLLGCAAAPSARATDRPEVRLTRFPKSLNQFVAGQVMVEVYRRCGMSARVDPVPPARAPLEALAGRVDGEVSRLRRHLDEFPALLCVEPAHGSFTMQAFAGRQLPVNGREDLRAYRVGVIRGSIAADELSAGLPSVEHASNSEALFLMLAAGRFDVALDVDINGALQVRKHSLARIRPVATVYSADQYHYLGPQHADWQERVSSQLAEMKRSGELARLRQRLAADIVAKGLEPD